MCTISKLDNYSFLGMIFQALSFYKPNVGKSGDLRSHVWKISKLKDRRSLNP
jgi:hypothetical protein